MKALFCLSIMALLAQPVAAQFGNVPDRVNNAATNRASQKIDQGLNKGLDKGEEGVRNGTKKKADSPSSTGSQSDNSTSSATGTAAATDTPATAAAPSMRSYTNYDLVPGSKPIFEDDFHTDQDAEFGEHRDLLGGQAILNKSGDGLVMKITDGTSGKVAPLMKTKNYLPKEFTIEYDYYQTPGAYPLIFWFNDADGSEVITCHASREGASASFQVNGEGPEPAGRICKAVTIVAETVAHHPARKPVEPIVRLL